MSEIRKDSYRRLYADVLNRNAAARKELANRVKGPTWNTEELIRDFEVKAFAAPFVSVVRRADGKSGLMLFQHNPWLYWGFEDIDSNVSYPLGKSGLMLFQRPPVQGQPSAYRHDHKMTLKRFLRALLWGVLMFPWALFLGAILATR